MSVLAIDCRWISTGLGAYTRNLVRKISKYPDLQLRLITSPQGKRLLEQFCNDIVTTDTATYSLQEQLRIPRLAGDCSVLHVPHYNVPAAYSKTLLVTIHDLNHILDRGFRKTLKSWIYAQPMLRIAALKSDHIFTVSQYSKRQIVEHLGASENKITVAYNGVSEHLYPEPKEPAQINTNHQFGFTGPYILFVGNLKPNKNVAGLLRAFAIVRQRRDVPHKLLIIGDDTVGRPAMMQLATTLGLGEAVIFAGTATDVQLRTAYSGADLTVLPSFEEGFGLPVLESMACGTAVACSDVTSLPEVGGDAAAYFDPRHPESIAEAVEKILFSSDLGAAMRQRGMEQASRFTWEASAEIHHAVYRKFLA